MTCDLEARKSQLYTNILCKIANNTLMYKIDCILYYGFKKQSLLYRGSHCPGAYHFTTRLKLWGFPFCLAWSTVVSNNLIALYFTMEDLHMMDKVLATFLYDTFILKKERLRGNVDLFWYAQFHAHS